MDAHQEWDPNSSQYDCTGFCARTYNTAEHPPIIADRFPYCVTCIEEVLDPFVNGDETQGLPKIGEFILTDDAELMSRINPDKRQKVEATLVWPSRTFTEGVHRG